MKQRKSSVPGKDLFDKLRFIISVPFKGLQQSLFFFYFFLRKKK